MDDHALEDTATCQRLLLLLLPEGKPSIELAESLAKDFNCSYAIHFTFWDALTVCSAVSVVVEQAPNPDSNPQLGTRQVRHPLGGIHV